MTTDEARLLATYRAVKRYGNFDLCPLEDASILAVFLPAVADIDEKEKTLSQKEIEILLDGLVIGHVISNLAREGLSVTVEPEKEAPKEA